MCVCVFGKPVKLCGSMGHTERAHIERNVAAAAQRADNVLIGFGRGRTQFQHSLCVCDSCML